MNLWVLNIFSMTVTELIHYLQKLDPDTKIIIRGYEDG
jgi:hypothetical protein